MDWALAVTSVFIVATAAVVMIRRRHARLRGDRATIVRAALTRARAKQRSLGRDGSVPRTRNRIPPGENR